MIRGEAHVDLARRSGPLSPLVYGQFIEHLGRCIYGGIFDPGSRLADGSGFRTDVIDAVRRLRVPVTRWPGGNFVSGYHWQDGVGPPDGRPHTWDRAWRKEEHNRFGTDEFIRWCRLVGTDPYICVNMGTGTAEEAAAWVEYCNGTGDTRYARLRRANGHPDPYGVVYWGLGNEVYGPWQLGHKSAAAYGEQAREFAKLLKWTDRRVRTIAVGAHDPEWDWEVLRATANFVDYISVHAYWRPQPDEDPHYSLIAQARREERYIRNLKHLIAAARERYHIGRPVTVAFDEWNVFYRRSDFRQYGTEHAEEYDLTDALAVACFLNVLVRNCDAVTMANMAQLVNVIAPIVTSPEGLYLQTIYFPLLLHAQCRGTLGLDAWSETDTFDLLSAGTVPYIDVAVAFQEQRRELYVYAVNIHREQAARLELRLLDTPAPGEGQLLTLDGPAVDARNSFEHPEVVTLARTAVRLDPRRPAVELAPASANCLVLRL